MTEEEIDRVAQTIYNRYHYEYGLKMQYKDTINKPIRDKLMLQVRETLDALCMLNYKVSKTEGSPRTEEFLVRKNNAAIL